MDLSHDMLRIARKRAATMPNVDAIIEMDLMQLAFPDGHFDGVICMCTITAVPDAKAVMAELARVTRPGGTVMIASHFEATSGPWKITDGILTPFAKRLGWNPSMPLDKVMGVPALTLVEQTPLPPAGRITLLVFKRHD